VTRGSLIFGVHLPDTLQACGLRVPELEDFSRLAFQNTCMAKRQLRWFIETGRVTEWSDPSFPTVRGILRRGMTLDALHSFLISQGASKADGLMEWDKIWSENRGVIDPLAPRHTALLEKGLVPLKIKGQKTESVKVPLHPKNADVGEKDVWLSSDCWLELADTQSLTEGEKITLMDYGNVRITKLTEKYVQSCVRSVDCNIVELNSHGMYPAFAGLV
jgi:glutamyl/glutaminyl-tRNA synthetase